MAEDSHGMGIPLPADSTKIHQFPGVTRNAMERVAELLAGGITEGQQSAVNALAEAAVDTELAASDVVKGNDGRVPVVNDLEPINGRYYRGVWPDKEGRMALGITEDGHAHAPLLDSARATLEVAYIGRQNIGAVETYEMDAEGYGVAGIDAAGRINEHALNSAGRVPDWVLAAWASRMGIAAVAGLESALPITAWGDSQTGQTFDGQKGWVDEFARQLGLTQPDGAYNRGFPGETSVAVAAKSGAVPAVWTAGGTIPADGPVTMLLKDHVDLMRWWAPMPCTLAGVHGTLTRHPDGNGAPTLDHPATFTRDVAGAAVVVPPNTPLISDWSATTRGNMTIIMSGRNNSGAGAADRVIADTRAMVEHLTALDRKWLVLSQINGSYRDAINAANKTAYGPRYINVLGYLASAQAMADAGIAPTAQDNTDIAAGNVPTSFYVDGTHLNGVGLITMGKYLAQIITGKEWL